jgi:uncharacterized protein (DUF1015 family)
MMENVDKLKEHEQTDPLRLEEIKAMLIKDDFQRDPIIVDKKTLVVVDGHHRLNALKQLGHKKVAVYYVNYLEDKDIIVRTWYPIILGSRRKLMKLVNEKFINSNSKQSPHGEFIVKDKIYSLKSGRESIMKTLVGKVRIDYAFTIEIARDLAFKGKVAGALIFKSVTKRDVINAALSGKKFPPKTTQNIIPNKPRNWYVPLKKLS